VNKANSDGRTALSLARHPAIRELLLRHGSVEAAVVEEGEEERGGEEGKLCYILSVFSFESIHVGLQLREVIRGWRELLGDSFGLRRWLKRSAGRAGGAGGRLALARRRGL
jgi:hypothetical protein